MRRRRWLKGLAAGALLAAVGTGCAVAQGVGGGPAMKDEATGAPAGEGIRQATLEGYRLEYYVIGLDGTRPTGAPTHHLMLYLTGPDGRPIDDAKVRYRVSGPAGSRPEVVAFYTKGRRVVRGVGSGKEAAGAIMEGGYGADVTLGDRAAYRVATDVVVGSVTLRDEFAYTTR